MCERSDRADPSRHSGRLTRSLVAVRSSRVAVWCCAGLLCCAVQRSLGDSLRSAHPPLRHASPRIGHAAHAGSHRHDGAQWHSAGSDGRSRSRRSDGRRPWSAPVGHGMSACKGAKCDNGTCVERRMHSLDTADLHSSDCVCVRCAVSASASAAVRHRLQLRLSIRHASRSSNCDKRCDRQRGAKQRLAPAPAPAAARLHRRPRQRPPRRPAPRPPPSRCRPS